VSFHVKILWDLTLFVDVFITYYLITVTCHLQINSLQGPYVGIFDARKLK
jgi:hypothetical protein